MPSTLRPDGLRARKKSRLESAIIETALHLFKTKGYAATTIEHIATACGVSPATVFRYFATKDEIIFHNNQLLFLDVFAALPPNLTLPQALQEAINRTVQELTPAQVDYEKQRQAIIASSPELVAKSYSKIAGHIDTLAQAIAERQELVSSTPRIRVAAGALIGVLLAAKMAPDSSQDSFETMVDYLQIYDEMTESHR